jgi:hypothetical protein
MVIRGDDVEVARVAGRRFRQESNPAESEVHVMSAEPSGTHSPTEEASDERRVAR